MKHARPDYDRIQDPAGIIPDAEPVFLLRAKDAAAPLAVEDWAKWAESMGASPEIVNAAREHARLMRQWQDKYGRKVPDMPQE